MPIKYAEITIIINEEKETMKNYFNRILFGNENKINDNDNIIILFDDESIYDIKNNINNDIKNKTPNKVIEVNNQLEDDDDDDDLKDKLVIKQKKNNRLQIILL